MSKTKVDNKRDIVYPTTVEEYRAGLARFKVGDWVRLLPGPHPALKWWQNSWVEGMTRLSQESLHIYQIVTKGSGHICMKGLSWSWPWYALELVETEEWIKKDSVVKIELSYSKDKFRRWTLYNPSLENHIGEIGVVVRDVGKYEDKSPVRVKFESGVNWNFPWDTVKVLEEPDDEDGDELAWVRDELYGVW